MALFFRFLVYSEKFGFHLQCLDPSFSLMTQSIPAQEKASTAVQCQNWPEQASPSRYVSKQRIFPVELEFFRVKEKKLKHVFILFNFLKYILTGFHK